MGTKKLIDPDKPSVISAWAYLMGIYLVWYFRKEGLDIKFRYEINEYKKYKDEKRFAELIGKVIRSEMSKFHVTPEEIKEVVKKVIKEPEFKIILD